jgi:hypothetical protein
VAGYYADARAMDPGTGDTRWSGATWATGRPMAECVLRIVRTRKGSNAADPDLGPDYDVLQKRRPDTGLAWQAQVRAALKRLTDPGLITDLSVPVEVVGEGVFFEVSFTDPNDTIQPRQTTGRQRA